MLILWWPNGCHGLKNCCREHAFSHSHSILNTMQSAYVPHVMKSDPCAVMWHHVNKVRLVNPTLSKRCCAEQPRLVTRWTLPRSRQQRHAAIEGAMRHRSHEIVTAKTLCYTSAVPASPLVHLPRNVACYTTQLSDIRAD